MRPRSPIEMMVDKACGFDPNAQRAAGRPNLVALDAEAQALLNVADAAKSWWEAGERGEVTARDVAQLKDAVAEWVHLGG